MSTPSDEDIFWDSVEEFINLANDKTESHDLGIISAAMMNATARFTAFYIASNAESRKDLKEDKDVLIQDIAREFKGRFADNLEDYIENYKIYLEKQDTE